MVRGEKKTSVTGYWSSDTTNRPSVLTPQHAGRGVRWGGAWCGAQAHSSLLQSSVEEPSRGGPDPVSASWRGDTSRGDQTTQLSRKTSF